MPVEQLTIDQYYWVGRLHIAMPGAVLISASETDGAFRVVLKLLRGYVLVMPTQKAVFACSAEGVLDLSPEGIQKSALAQTTIFGSALWT